MSYDSISLPESPWLREQRIRKARFEEESWSRPLRYAASGDPRKQVRAVRAADGKRALFKRAALCSLGKTLLSVGMAYLAYKSYGWSFVLSDMFHQSAIVGGTFAGATAVLGASLFTIPISFTGLFSDVSSWWRAKDLQENVHRAVAQNRSGSQDAPLPTPHEPASAYSPPPSGIKPKWW